VSVYLFGYHPVYLFVGVLASPAVETVLFFCPCLVCVANRAIPVCSSVLNKSLELGSVKRCGWIVTETHFHVETY
jgi:hypothetical protein